MKILEIQYLRAIAALLVLVQHACAKNSIDFRIGHVGVDIFFIISGFVMWVTTYGRHINFRGFMLRRLRRVAPLYWIATIITLGPPHLILTITILICNVARSGHYYGGYVGIEEFLKSCLFIPYHNTYGKVAPIVAQGWTLNIEILFYLIFALTVARCPWQRLWIPTVILTSFVAIGSLCNFSSAIGAVWTKPVLMELVAGLWLGYAYTSGWLRYRRTGWVLITASIVIYSFFWRYGLPEHWRVGHAVPFYLVCGLPSLALVAGCLMVNHDRDIPEIPALLFIGDASYSVYIWHLLVIFIVSPIPHWLGAAEGIENAFLLVLCALPVTLLAYVLIERPLKALLPSPRVAPVA